MEIDAANQTFCFFMSVMLGIILAVIYILNGFIRKITGENIAICWLADISFFLLSALSLTVLFFVLTNGEIRIFMLIGTLLGGVGTYLLYHRLSSIIQKTANKRKKY